MELNVILSDIYASFRLQELHFSEFSESFGEIDYHFRKQLFPSYDYTELFQDMIKHVSFSSPVYYRDDLGLYYLVYLEPGQAQPSYTFVGPFLQDTFTEADYLAILEKRNVPPHRLEDIKAFFFRITVIEDVICWRTLTDRMISRCYGQDTSFVHISSSLPLTTLGNDIEQFPVPQPVAAFSALEARYEIETNLIHAVQKGSISEALHFHNLFMGFHLEPRVDDELRDAKDMLLAINTFLRKAVQEVHVHPLYIDNLNANMTRQIEEATSVMQLNTMCPALIRKYCLLVKSYSRKQYSTLVRDTLNYIDFHYQENLTLSFFAEKYSISKNHLSSLFHKETDMTLTDYINSTRVRHSLLLLNTTTLSIQEIAERCGFSDANYFTRSFKKYQGTTPLKYRQSILGSDGQ